MRPKKPEKIRARVSMPMPDAYVYGSTGDAADDDECVSDAERVVIMTPIVTKMTDMICVRVYLENGISIMTIHGETL